jgi:hypothetical protein
MVVPRRGYFSLPQSEGHSDLESASTSYFIYRISCKPTTYSGAALISIILLCPSLLPPSPLGCIRLFGRRLKCSWASFMLCRYSVFIPFLHSSRLLNADCLLFAPYVRSRINPTAPYPSSKPTRRLAPNHTTSTSSLTSTRRDSLPALHLHTPSQPTLTVSIAPSTMQENLENFNDDDYYAHSSLATFSFGAATAHRQPFDPGMCSPLSVQSTSESGRSHSTSSIDHTPRPSISHTRGPDDEGGEDETRRSRAKMRAIDDGGRRPSLPTNIYTPDRRGDDNLPTTSSRRHAGASGSDSDAITSGNASDADFDRGCESGIVDTDVELEGLVPDDTSQNTFGFDPVSFFTHSITRSSLMVMVPSPLNRVKIGTSSTPSSAVKIPHPPSYLHPTRAKMTTQTYQKQVLVDLRLCTATALPFEWPPHGNVLSTQTKWIPGRYKWIRGSARVALPQCAGQTMKTGMRAYKLLLQAQTENGDRHCRLLIGACSPTLRVFRQRVTRAKASIRA